MRGHDQNVQQSAYFGERSRGLASSHVLGSFLRRELFDTTSGHLSDHISERLHPINHNIICAIASPIVVLQAHNSAVESRWTSHILSCPACPPFTCQSSTAAKSTAEKRHVLESGSMMYPPRLVIALPQPPATDLPLNWAVHLRQTKQGSAHARQATSRPRNILVSTVSQSAKNFAGI